MIERIRKLAQEFAGHRAETEARLAALEKAVADLTVSNAAKSAKPQMKSGE
jgi:hypothetical protein